MDNFKWISAWSSRVGSSHIVEGIPCQDSSKVQHIENSDFIVAAVSDGAGSCINSHIGSSFLVDRAIERMASAFKYRNWFEKENVDLTPESWREEVFLQYRELKEELHSKAVELGVDFKSLSATLILAISNGQFIACASIGDGRAAFRDLESEWFPMMVPTKGEEANQTIFITSDLWDEDIGSDYFGTFFYENPITAFSLLTDGCERASFEILKFSEEENKYFDPNKPYKPFFEPNYLNLVKLGKANFHQGQINALWGDFLDKGNNILLNETDDKSMILSVSLISQMDESEGQTIE